VSFIRSCTSLRFSADAIWKHLAVIILASTLAACSSTAVRSPVPAELSAEAQVQGIPNARFWGDDISPELEQQLTTLSKAEVKSQFPALYGKPHNYLAISGGGSNGAFGAGLLNGWTESGTRPDFQMVTGISTGALIAPFAFLGPDYDYVLKEVYTTISTEDIMLRNSLFALLYASSAFNSDPLFDMIKKYVDDEVVARIAAEYRTGKGLYIGTTDLDSMRPVIWDIGAIAASGQADSKRLIHKIMLASASIPGAFPPVSFDLQVNGQHYDELHVDGGTANQVFVYPAATDWHQVLELLDVPEMNVYVIRNSSLKPARVEVEPKLLSIAGRSVSSLIRTQGLGDLYLIYLLAKRDGGNFHLAYIPDDFDHSSQEAFDNSYMKELYSRGYEIAVDGYPWGSMPPGLKHAVEYEQ
jgi:predicted acylesterase/phospholipase RssA